MTTFMTVDQAAAYAGLSTRQLLRNAKAGEFTAHRFGKRFLFVRTELQTWKKKHLILKSPRS